jgi:hypothetical protein
MIIRVHVPLARNAIPYYNYMRKNYQSLCSNETKLEFYVHSIEGDLGVQADKQFICQTSKGSNGHAIGITSALTQPVTEDIKIIADSDTVMLSKDWDLRLKLVFSQYQDYGIVGTSYERIGGFSTEGIKRQAYKFKPTLTWAALSPKYDFSKMMTMPAKHENIVVDTLEKSILYNLPIGFELFRDAAWQVPEYLHDNKIPYVYLENFRPTQPQTIAIKSGNDYNEEFQLWGFPFVGHQRGSNKRPFRACPESIGFYDSVERYLSATGGNPRPTD